MIIGIGSDIVALARFEALEMRFGDRLYEKLFTQAERAQAGEQPNATKRVAYLAKRFAAKEATAKALGCGIGKHAHWQEIEALKTNAGAVLTLCGYTADYLQTLLPKGTQAKLHLSLSDEQEHALAFVVIEAR